MSKPEITKAVLTQILSGLLEALDPQSGCEAFVMEPNLAYGIVDIVWVDQSGNRRASQVRASESQMSKTQVEGWAKTFRDARSADRYELLLLGHATPTVLAQKHVQGVELQVRSPHPDTSLQQLAHRLDIFLTTNGADRLLPQQYITLSNTLIDKLATFSTDKKTLRLVEFNQLLITWVEEAFPGRTHITPPPVRHGIGLIRFARWLKSKFSKNLNTALLLMFLSGLGYLSVELGIVDKLNRRLRGREISLQADAISSGSGYESLNRFDNFEQQATPVGIGDMVFTVAESPKDYRSKVFLSFNLNEIPPGVEVEQAQLQIPCQVIGNVSSLGRLRVTSIAYGEYEAHKFDTYMGWPHMGALNAYIRDDGNLGGVCEEEGAVWIGGRAIASDIQVSTQRLQPRYQVVLWFDGVSIVPNANSDAFVVTALPTLRIRYTLDR